MTSRARQGPADGGWRGSARHAELANCREGESIGEFSSGEVCRSERRLATSRPMPTLGKVAQWRQDRGPAIRGEGALALGIRRAEGFWRLGVRSLQFPFVTLTSPVMAYSVLVSPCKL